MLKKRAVILVLTMILMMSMTVNAFAAIGNPGEIVSPNYLYTTSVSTELSISSGTATCKSVIKGESGVATQVCIYMYLEKFDETDKTWDTVKSWSGVFDGNKGLLEKTTSVDSGAYRLRTSYWAYAGTASENFVQYSTIERC